MSPMVPKLSRPLVTGLLLASSGTAANASIVVFDIDPDAFFPVFGYGYKGIGELNFADGTFSNPAAYTVSFGVQGNYQYVDFVGGLVGFSSTFFQAGESIGLGVFSSRSIRHEKAFTPEGIYYLGLRREAQPFQVQYGWLELQVTDSGDFLGEYNDITLTRFAFNDAAGQTILAGQTTAVPEASTLGFAGGLFGLVALAHARRRQQKKSAASEKFLALAAGEKLN